MAIDSDTPRSTRRPAPRYTPTGSPEAPDPVCRPAPPPRDRRGWVISIPCQRSRVICSNDPTTAWATSRQALPPGEVVGVHEHEARSGDVGEARREPGPLASEQVEDVGAAHGVTPWT